MTDQVVLSAYPSRLRVSVSPRGYLLLGATGGTLLLSVLSNDGFVLAFGGALGLFLLGELYTVTLRLREFIERAEVTVAPVASENTIAETSISVSFAPVSEPLDVDSVTLIGRVGENRESAEGPSPTVLDIPVSVEDSRVKITLTVRVASPGHVGMADLTVVDADVPVEELYASGGDVSSGNVVTTPEQHGSEPESSISGNEYDGLREYVAGDPLSHIDWKATARQRSVHVREWAREQPTMRVILLDLPSLPHPTWKAAARVCREQLRQRGDTDRSVAAVVRPSGESVFDPDGYQTPEAGIEHIERTIEDVSEVHGVPSDVEATHAPRRPFRQATRVGKTVAAFQRRGGVPDNSLTTALHRIRRQVGDAPSLSLITGGRTATRTLAGVRSATGRGAVEVHLLSLPEQGDKRESLGTTLTAETGVSLTERPLYRRGVVRHDTQRPAEYALTRQIRGR
jgi:uncharacterized protein (DUF58 family)